ncbi:rhodanese-like domain-containing protein [Tuwongella immobilis]|uniref:Rhodanese domain-containing protein n=1 Tax=Tuwongella immobilis TaxID=692036 RepID=A0A6C2YHH0_9BACT|nr:rhodanese-like domain-containing protein [Tuwongella immobilis]VIP00936.1 rhodanese domain-containing protein : Rhodanese-related sulfurtransferase OS=Singulisphaera acidiphila (strain ATCC BAA-1392 / DSM 18658 / VKM B-2454 / MOB10) GN=Sinac_0437 PE=4 SV=1: Rhodanese: DUF2892 [Tuwongella immobilis]VTR97290.1 rhodanese domain-containing protein : Rhodanese-related sulfurtransferase OS=Singulisphaera acidiphila (strain ATCC BAA-1392 / DSM 18658 / VKM B-2454 / MOB10) GN=Sinac_0437 PE=4 SV=1: Rhod
MSISTIHPRELNARISKGETIDLIDVRTPMEYQELHATPARNVPLTELDPAAVMQNRQSSADQPIFLICRSGSRGKQACEKFLAAGYTNVVNVEGGTTAWAECTLPVVRGKKVMSLERQVRIAAGALVFLGTLASLLTPWALIVPGFVGAGLVFAGITDTCGMGMLIARMPWNRGPASCSR